MSYTLVVVESPAKAKTIERYLGKDYKIVASVGHIRDLPSGTLGVDVDNDFKPRYITMRGKTQVIKDLRKAAKDAESVLIATDPDREGEAIAWHVADVLKIPKNELNRISFNEITAKAVNEAVEKPRAIDMDLFDAQQARRILDRLVGYELSPLLWDKVRRGLSAGRVQSVATKLLVDREREIASFIPEEYWHLFVDLETAKKETFRARWLCTVEPGKKIKEEKLNNKEDVDLVLAAIKDQLFAVSEVKRGTRRRQPYAPFTTSTLQQDASSRLGYSSGRTMRIAQQLYEGVTISGHGQTALVTYIRTDSTRISNEAIRSVREYIAEHFNEKYLPKSPKTYRSKGGAQDAHECIRPTYLNLPPDEVRGSLTNEQFKLYELIWNRFVACQMNPATFATYRVDIDAANQRFRANGERLTFPGFLAVYGETIRSKDDDDEDTNQQLPELEEGDSLKKLKEDAQQKFTRPPARYTEASLIRAMEERGIGRPSTYAPTISTILNRHYADKDGRSLQATELGSLVTDFLTENFAEIVDDDFTAKMEERLDDVEEGKEDWIALLKEFYPPFHDQIETVRNEVPKIELPEEKLDEVCPECNEGQLIIRLGRNGRFIACNRFPDCTYTRSILDFTDRKCPKCGSQVVRRKSKRGRTFFTCDQQGNDPTCDFISWNLPVDDKFCEICGAFMEERQSRGQTFTQCSNKDCASRKKRSSKKKDA